MITVTAVTDDKGAKSFLVDLGNRVTDRRALNEVLAERFAMELREHWAKKNAKPNRLGGERTNFWAGAAKAVAVEGVNEAGATVKVGGLPGERIRIHLHGGTIKPVNARFLTIPIAREAHGLRASEYEERTGKDLFRIPGKRALFEKVDSGSRKVVMEDTDGRTNRHGPGNSIPLARGQRIRPVYLLAARAVIPRDPDAMPDEAKLLAALQEEAEDWLDAGMEGGLP